MTEPDARPSVFWQDLADDLEDPEFLRQYTADSVRIAALVWCTECPDGCPDPGNTPKCDDCVRFSNPE
jgi:hypothetical protein